MDYNSRNPHLGLNRLSKPIRKPPLHHPQPPPAAAPRPPQPQVYNISKNDFRSIVQQLTGTPTRDPANPNPIPPPPSRHHPSMRLQRIRPPPLSPIARPPPPIPAANPRPAWADSPVSAYMRYLETSLQLSPAPPPPSVPSPGFQSPTAFLNLLSPRSPYPLLSPGFQHPPPLSPNFSFSPMMPSQQGVIGPGPLSPGLRYPLSPSGYLSSPRWRDM